MVADPTPANSTNRTYTLPLGHDHHKITLVLLASTTRQNPAIKGGHFYITITFKVNLWGIF